MEIINEKNANKTFKKTIMLVVLLFLILFVASVFIPRFRHRPYLINQTEVLFCDSSGDAYFSLVGRDDLRKYNNAFKNHYESVRFFDEDGSSLNQTQVVSNSDYVFAGLEHAGPNTYGVIQMMNKSFELIKTLRFNSGFIVRGLACTDYYLYYVLKNIVTGTYSLHKLTISNDNDLLLEDNLENMNSFEDEDIRMFFSDLFYIQIASQRTILICRSDNKNGYSYLTDGLRKLFIFKGNLHIDSFDKQLSFKTKGEYNCLYDKAVVIENHLLFATYRNIQNDRCGSSSNLNGNCICGMKKSFLFDFNLITNSLSMIKVFKEGTFLIDYDLNNYSYYYQGGLFTNGTIVAQCELVKAGKEELISQFAHFNELEKNYYISYYNECFYGI